MPHTKTPPVPATPSLPVNYDPATGIATIEFDPADIQDALDAGWAIQPWLQQQAQAFVVTIRSLQPY